MSIYRLADLADLVESLLLLDQVVAPHVSTRSATAAVAADKAFGKMSTYIGLNQNHFKGFLLEMKFGIGQNIYLGLT